MPAATEVPLSRWTGPELLAEVIRAGWVVELSVSSVLRILAEHPVKPWQYRSWISPATGTSPPKAAVILDLYQGYYQGARLRPGDRERESVPTPDAASRYLQKWRYAFVKPQAAAVPDAPGSQTGRAA